MASATDLPDPSAWLDHGAIGALALLCMVVLGVNVWKLYALIGEGDTAKMNAARPLLFGVMGFTAFCLGMAMVVFFMLNRDARTITLVLRPSIDRTVDSNAIPLVSLANRKIALTELSSIIRGSCDVGRDTPIEVNFEPYINWRLRYGSGFASVAVAPADLAPRGNAASLATFDPQVN